MKIPCCPNITRVFEELHSLWAVKGRTEHQQPIPSLSRGLNWTIKFKRLICRCGCAKKEGRPHQWGDLWPTPFSAPITTKKTRKRAKAIDDKPKHRTNGRRRLFRGRMKIVAICNKNLVRRHAQGVRAANAIGESTCMTSTQRRGGEEFPEISGKTA